MLLIYKYIAYHKKLDIIYKYKNLLNKAFTYL